MTYWWVNHKQTSNQELSGGYLWSPKCESNGNRSQYYDYMRETRPGDVVVSFANAEICHAGIVNGLPTCAPKPVEFGSTGYNWSGDGWLVPVGWKPISKPFRPKDKIDRIRQFLPTRYSPIQASGNGNQKAYLTKINEDLYKRLAALGQISLENHDTQFDQIYRPAIVDKIEDHLQDLIKNDGSMDETERNSVIKARRGQGIF